MKGFDEEYDVVVIGAGIGGLVCGAYLAKNGKSVKILEQHYVPGGCCSSFSRKGFLFDAGVVHVAGGKESGAFQRVLSALDMEEEIEFKEQHLRFVFPDVHLDSTRDLEELPRKCQEMFPEEREGIAGLFSTIQAIYEDVKKLPSISPLVARYQDRSFEDLVNDYIRNPKLKALVNANWHLWSPPWNNSAIDYASLLVTEQIRGYFYPMGGVQVIPDALVRVLKRHGGEIEFKTLVDKIVVEEGRAVGVATKKGNRIRARQVVSNMAARPTLFDLVGEAYLPTDYVQGVKKLEISLSSFYVYLGVNMDPRAGGIEKPETIVYESYDNSSEWKRLLSGQISIPCFGIAVPSLLDPGLAPPGKHVVIVMTMAPYHLEGTSWKEEKKRMAQLLIAKAEKLIVGLSEHIEVLDAATPLTYERYTLNSLGAAEGWAFSPTMFLKRVPQQTPIEDLYLVGHWTMPGGSVPGVALSGLRAARSILSTATNDGANS